VLDADGTGERETILAEARARLRRALLLGASRHPEAENPTALENALARLVDEGILAGDDPARRRGARVHAGPRFDDLESLCERLAGALGTG
jgi:hypothetical protein